MSHAAEPSLYFESSNHPLPLADLIRFADVPQLPGIPRRRGGARLAAVTVHRWATAGVRNCRLRYTCVGGVRCTTRPWLREFFDAIAAQDRVGPPATPVTNSPATQRRADAAARQLEKEGFGG